MLVPDLQRSTPLRHYFGRLAIKIETLARWQQLDLALQYRLRSQKSET